MMTSSRRRPGRHLQPVNALSLLHAHAALRSFHEKCVADGFRLKETVRPYLRKDGDISMRFIWRKRSPGLSLSIEYAVRMRGWHG